MKAEMIAANEIEAIAKGRGLAPGFVCFSARMLLPVLREWSEGKRWYHRWGVALLLDALDILVLRNCPDQTPGAPQA